MKYITLLLVLAMVLAACAGLPGKAHYPNPVTPEMKGRFDSANVLYQARRFSEADRALEGIITDFPYTEITDISRFLRGEIAFTRKDYSTALSFYQQAVSQVVSPSVAPKAYFKAALSLYRLGRPQDAVSELAKIDRRTTSAVLKIRIDSLGARVSRASGMSPNASVVWYLNLLDDYADATDISPYGIAPDELIQETDALTEVRRWMGDGGVTIAQIDALPLKEMKGKKSGGFAAYKRALVLHTTGDTKGARKQLESYLTTYPKHESYSAARLLLGEMGGAIGEGAGVVIGVILPLTGKYAVHGESALHGIECAAGVYEPCEGPAGIKIVVKDSESTPGGVIGAVDELADEGVVAIIGPLLSSSALEAARSAQEKGIPMISLSQRDGIAQVGDYTFRNSVSDAAEISTLAAYAVGEMGLKHFFTIYPPSRKGGEYKNLFAESVKALGGNINGSQLFSPSVRIADDELRGRGAVEFKAWAGVEPRRQEEGQAIDFSAIGDRCEAIFIPDSVATAGYIAKRLELSAATKGNLKFLGISRWGDQKLIERAGPSLEGAVFVDSFYKNAPDVYVQTFITRFRTAYGIEPTLLEALGYDSMRILISAVQEKGAHRRESVRNALARVSSFPGVAGKTSFDEQGDARRELWVLRIKGGQIQIAK